MAGAVGVVYELVVVVLAQYSGEKLFLYLLPQDLIQLLEEMVELMQELLKLEEVMELLHHLDQ